MKIRKSWIATIATSCSAVALASSPAVAQENAVDQASSEPDESGSDFGNTIIVTAQKREQAVNDVGLSIQAFTGDTLAQAGVEGIEDLGQVVSGFAFAQSTANTPIYTIRGVGFNTPNLSSTSPVGIYFDEISYAYPFLASGPNFDLERVEVLKGPQGTLYGRNTTGGLVNVIVAKPTQELGGYITAELGNFETTNVEGALNIPLGPDTALRFSGRYERSGEGWQQLLSDPGERHGEVDRLGLRAIFLTNPTDGLEIQLGVNYWQDNSDTIATQAVEIELDTPGFEPANLSDFVIADFPRGFASLTAPGQGSPERPPFESNSDFLGLSARVSLDLNDSLTLVSLTGYNEVDRDDVTDLDGTPFEFADFQSTGSIESFSQEIRLEGSGDNFDWIVGGYYSNDTISDDQIGFFADSTILNSLSFIALVPALEFPPGSGDFLTAEQIAQVFNPALEFTDAELAVGFDQFRNDSDQDSESWSIFGNFEWQLDDQFRLVGGLRYSNDSLDFAGCSRDFNGNTLPIWNTSVRVAVLAATGVANFDPIGVNECLTFSEDFSSIADINELSLDEDNVSGRIALNFEPNPDALLYASISRGFKSGAFPVVSANNVTQLEPATQEELLAYELGAKLTLADGAVQLNGAVFYYDYSDQQQFSDIADLVFETLTRIVNVPDSRIIGAEVDLTIQPSRQLFLNFNASYVDSRIGDFVGFDVFALEQNFEGSEFANTPPFQASAAASYDFDLSENLGLEVNISGRHQSRSFAQLGEDPRLRIDAFTVVNAQIALHDFSDTWRVGLYANNLFNEDFFTQIERVTDTIFRVPGQIRTYGIRTTYNF